MQRVLASTIHTHLQTHKVLILQGPKKVGKSELILNQLQSLDSLLHIDCSVKKNRVQFDNPTVDSLREIIQDNTVVLLQEAQRLNHLQAILEEIVFNDWNVNLVLTCSYEPVLEEALRDALEQQGLILTLLPLTFQEIANEQGVVAFDKTITDRLIFGNYPAVLEQPDQAETLLNELVQDAIFTQLNPSERINKGDKLMKMLQVLAFEVGQPISYNDIGFQVGLDNETVERYIDLFQKAFILIKIPSFYNGNKYELKKTHTVYFLDNGIRNAVIRNLNPVDFRNDLDALWKNWLVAERVKWNRLNGNQPQYFFWRTHTKQQIDFIEVNENDVVGYKSIWDKRKKPKFPKSFSEAYPTAILHALNRSTYWGFLSKK